MGRGRKFYSVVAEKREMKMDRSSVPFSFLFYSEIVKIDYERLELDLSLGEREVIDSSSVIYIWLESKLARRFSIIIPVYILGVIRFIVA